MMGSRDSLIRVALLVFSLSLATLAQDAGTVTFLEGSMHIVRGTMAMRGAEGLRLRRGDIVENSNPGFVQVELPGGTVVALGPSTRVLFLAHAARAPEIAMLSGWLKAEIPAKAGTYEFVTPLLGATAHDGSVVLHATGDAASIFVESGSAAVGSVSPDGFLVHAAAASPGQFFSRRRGGGVTNSARPDSAFLDAVPRPFRDTLPPRIARFPKAVEPKPDHEVSYSEIEPWLNADRAWRRGFVERFQPRLKDAEFRRSVDAHLAEHPEWDPILHPEKYAPKTGPATAENPNPGGNSR